ncbi:MAG: hypothetical protein D6731_20875, partial [Planctomycetota bacterium]
MGNLNQFYLLGRVASPPTVVALEGERSVVNLAILPGTGPRAPRGPVHPLDLEAHGPQVEAARSLRVGQAVLLRGQLRQEERGGGPRLVARVQAIELVSADGGRGPVGRDGETSARRRRRRKPRAPRGEGAQAGAPAQGARTADAAEQAAPNESAVAPASGAP